MECRYFSVSCLDHACTCRKSCVQYAGGGAGAIDTAREDNNFWHIDDVAWSQINGQSVDYAILEKIEEIACVKFSGNGLILATGTR